ncbi:Leucine-responsive regulatory protein [Serratia plymuthica]|uniref:Leucine-responsive regulatory protein n=1 Tax=Serratia plymuthica TaxID=82996 RepID=A0A2X4V8K8_SERPL|nr:Leucine-responsive regulatory protein [Serratia plymuthica]
MDKIDRKILAELQFDGRLSVTELADRIGLSVSPAIAGYAPWSNPG